MAEYGSNPFGFDVLPFDLWNLIYGQTPRPASSPAPFSGGGSGGIASSGLSPTGFPTPQPMFPPGVPGSGLEFPGSETPMPPIMPSQPVGGDVTPGELTNPPQYPEIPSPPIPSPLPQGPTPPPVPGVTPPGGVPPMYSSNSQVPGVKLSLRDILARLGLPTGMGGLGQPMGFFPPGTTHPMGTFGIVNPSMPAGGGSYFGGRSNPAMWLPGSTYNLGGSGGMLSSPWQIYFGTRSPGFLNWAAQQGISRHDATRMFSQFPTAAPSQSGATQGAMHAGQKINPV